MIHIGMVNSFNVITEKNTFEEIVSSDVSLLAHIPENDVPLELIKLMVEYFKSYEMFEHCIELVEYMSLNYNKDGTAIVIIESCECPQPLIVDYSKKMFCGNCDKRLKK